MRWIILSFIAFLPHTFSTSVSTSTLNFNLSAIRSECPAPCKVNVEYCVNALDTMIACCNNSVIFRCPNKNSLPMRWVTEVEERTINLTFSYDPTQKMSLRVSVKKDSISLLELEKNLENYVNETADSTSSMYSTQVLPTIPSENNEIIGAWKEKVIHLQEQFTQNIFLLNNTIQDQQIQIEELHAKIARFEDRKSDTKRDLSKGEDIQLSRLLMRKLALIESRLQRVLMTPTAKMIELMRTYSYLGLSPIFCDKSGHYDTINWSKINGHENWSDCWRKLKRRQNCWFVFPPIILPIEYGETVIMMQLYWKDAKLQLRGKIDDTNKIMRPPSSAEVNLHLKLFTNYDILLQTEQAFALSTCCWSTMVNIDVEIQRDWPLPRAQVKVLPPKIS